MTPTEFESWSKFMRESRGHWTLDPIHNGELNGQSDRLLVFCPKADDETAGVYVMVDGCRASAGQFEDALPHMGDALYRERWSKEFANRNEAMTCVIERLGVPFLLGLTHGRSPYRGPVG